MGQVVFSSSYRTGQTGPLRCNVKITFSEDYNASTNKTTITITGVAIQFEDNSVNWGSMTMRGSISVAGTTLVNFGGGSASVTCYLDDDDYCSVSGFSSSSVTVEHDATGAKTVTFAITGGGNSIDGVYYLGAYYNYNTIFGASTQSKSVALTTRPRISSISGANGYFGEAMALTITRYNSSFTHTVKTSCAGRTETLMTKGSSTSLSWTPSLSTYANLVTSSMSASVTITCETYNGNTLVGTSTSTYTLTFRAADVKPDVSIATADPTGNLTTYGKYVKTKSKIQVTATPSFVGGASLASVSITANGATYNTSPSTTDFISSVSNTTVSVTIVDSRGQSRTRTVTIQIYDYTPPQIIAFSVHRCDSDGTDNNTGAYMKVSYSVAITNLGTQHANSKALTVYYKKISASSYSNRSVTLSSYTQSGVVSDPYITADTSSTYDVKLALTDDFSTTESALSLPTAAVHMNHGTGVNGGVAFGKVSEYDKTLEVADDWAVKCGAISATGNASVTRAAEVHIYANNTAQGHKVSLCVGTSGKGGVYDSKHSKWLIDYTLSGDLEIGGKTFVDLVYPVGSIYMSVNSNSPATLFGGTWVRLKDRFLLGAGSTYSNGATGGEATHTLTVDEMPAHTHKSQGYWQTPDSGGHNAIARTTVSTDPTDTNSLKNTGGGQAHNNMPPYLVVYMWKRTA